MRRGLTWHWGMGRELGFVFWAMVCVEAAFGSYMSIWPLWIQALGAPIAIVGLVLGSQGLLRPLTLGPSAALAERFEARKLITAARLITGIGMISAALATNWVQLFFFVVCTAIGELAFPLTQAHLAAHAGEQRVRAFTLVFNVGPAAALGLSPLLSGLLVAVWGMPAAFLAAAFWTMLSIVFFSRLSAGRDVDRSASPPATTYRDSLRQPGVARLVTLQFATIFVLALGISLVPTFLAEERSMDPASITMLGSIGAVGSVSFGLLVTRLPWLHRSPFRAIAIAVTLVVVSMSIIVGSHLIWLILIGFLGRGGLFSAWGLFVAAASEITSERFRPRLFALCEMAGGMAFSFAPILAGVLYGVRPDLPLLSSIIAGLVIVPVLLANQSRLRPSDDVTTDGKPVPGPVPLPSDPDAPLVTVVPDAPFEVPALVMLPPTEAAKADTPLDRPVAAGSVADTGLADDAAPTAEDVPIAASARTAGGAPTGSAARNG